MTNKIAGPLHPALDGSIPGAHVDARDDWLNSEFEVKMAVDPERAELNGVTNLDVTRSTSAALVTWEEQPKQDEGARPTPDSPERQSLPAT